MIGIYAIVDVTGARPPEAASQLAREFLDAGIKTIQLRAKALPVRAFLGLARDLRALTRAAGALLVIDDRPDIAMLSDADAVHLGQDDLPAAAARAWLPERIKIGISCHSAEQVIAAAPLADYLGYGPIFPTNSKKNPDPVVGLEGLRAIRSAHPELQLVAIGGIDHDRLRMVKQSGANAAAMISALTGAESARRALAIWESA